VEILQGKAAPMTFGQDETIRPDSTPDVLKGLKPAFKKDGSITAGNAPGVNDGAAAVVVMSEERARDLGAQPMARITGHATSGIAPKLLLMTPVGAIRKLLEKIGWRIEDVDLFEINEAFAAQMVAVISELGLDPARVNVNGGAIALGHPIGASGARVLTTLLYAMKERRAKRGIASLCLGGGNGVALAVEV
jgi:acetyl-CoA C-acetyltransferase